MNKSRRIQFLQTILTSKEFHELTHDRYAFQQALNLYDEAYMDSVYVYACNTKRFLILKKDLSKLLPSWKHTLGKLSLQKDILNPVYVEVEENGTFLIN